MPTAPKRDLLNIKATPDTIIELAERLAGARQHFEGFVRLMHPEFDLQPFHLVIIEALDRLEKRTLTKRFMLEFKLPGWEKVQELAEAGVVDLDRPVYRLMINVPPRHGKSQLATCLFPAYFILRNTKRKILAQSYSDTLAKDFGGRVQGYAKHPFARQAFPTIGFDKQYGAKDFWKTSAGGQCAFVGLEGTTTGRPANLLLTDDPIKGRKEAESAAHQRLVSGIYWDSLDTRREPELADEKGHEAPPIEVMILTRWSAHDIAGELMGQPEWDQDWVHLKFQAVTEVPTGKMVPTGLVDDSGKAIYKPELEYQTLWPGRYDVERFLRIKERKPHTYSSLYQQEPVIAGGNVVKTGKFQRYAIREDRYAATVFGVDTAAGLTNHADYSVFCHAGITYEGDIHILDVIRGRFDYPELKARAIKLNSLYRGKGALKGFYIEPKSSGISLLQDLRRTPGISAIKAEMDGDKMLRLNLIMPLVHGGRVFLPESAEWLDDFLTELQQFPSGKNDDQVDAFVYAVDALSKMNVEMRDDMFGSIEDLVKRTQPFGTGTSDEHLMMGLGADGLPKALGEL